MRARVAVAAIRSVSAAGVRFLIQLSWSGLVWAVMPAAMEVRVVSQMMGWGNQTQNSSWVAVFIAVSGGMGVWSGSGGLGVSMLFRARREGIEPSFSGPKPDVLPLYDLRWVLWGLWGLWRVSAVLGGGSCLWCYVNDFGVGCGSCEDLGSE